MKHLHNVQVYWVPYIRRWVVKHEMITKPINKHSTVSTSRLFLTPTAFKALKAEIAKHDN